MIGVKSVRRMSWFSNLVSKPYTKQHVEDRIVACNSTELYNVVKDVNSYQSFVPYCTQSKITKYLNNNNNMEAELGVGFQLFTEKYMSKVYCTPESKIRTVSTKSANFELIQSEWQFIPIEKYKTRVLFKIQFKVNSILYAQAIKLFFNELVRSQFKAFVNQTKRASIRH